VSDIVPLCSTILKKGRTTVLSEHGDVIEMQKRFVPPKVSSNLGPW